MAWEGARPGLSPLVQEGVEKCEEQQGQLGQQRHPVVEVEGVCRAVVVGPQGPGGAIGHGQPPLEVLPGCRESGDRVTIQHTLRNPWPPPRANPHPGMARLVSVGTVLVLSPAPGTQSELGERALN